MSTGKIVLVLVGITVAVTVGVILGLRFGLAPAHRAEANAVHAELQDIELQKVAAVRQQVGNIAETLDIVSADSDYPSSLLGLTEGANPPLKLKHLMDAWGQMLVYYYPSRHGRVFDLCSAGPDLMPGTPDDICYDGKLNR